MWELFSWQQKFSSSKSVCMEEDEYFMPNKEYFQEMKPIEDEGHTEVSRHHYQLLKI